MEGTRERSRGSRECRLSNPIDNRTTRAHMHYVYTFASTRIPPSEAGESSIERRVPQILPYTSEANSTSAVL